MFSSDFNPLLSVLQKYTDDKGNVAWDALINEIKSMASLFAGNRSEMLYWDSYGRNDEKHG